MSEAGVAIDKPTPVVLIVDEDKVISELIVNNLENEGYRAESCQNADKALDLDLTAYTLIISETDFTEGPGGLRFAEMIKQNPDTAPVSVIFCSTRDSEDDIINGFNAGADDYILKPFSLREMMARVRSVIRRRMMMMRAAKPRVNVVAYNGLSVNLDSSQVTLDGEPLALTRTEFKILSLMLRNLNRYFTREEIFNEVWAGQESGSDRTVDVNISRLRKKLGDYASHIVNRSGFGYGFME